MHKPNTHRQHGGYRSVSQSDIAGEDVRLAGCLVQGRRCAAWGWAGWRRSSRRWMFHTRIGGYDQRMAGDIHQFGGRRMSRSITASFTITTGYISSQSRRSGRIYRSGWAGIRGGLCGARRSMGTHGIPRGRRRSSWQGICRIFGSRRRRRQGSGGHYDFAEAQLHISDAGAAESDGGGGDAYGRGRVGERARGGG